jgi:hypothetical protein
MVIGILFGGFYINIDSLPIVANWIPYFSIFRWTFQVSSRHQTSDIRTARLCESDLIVN